MQHCATRIGDAYFRTPRETVKGFLDLLALLDQHPEVDWRSLLNRVDLDPIDPADPNEPADPIDPAEPLDLTSNTAGSWGDEAFRDDELSTFRL
jgi:hypothetical protein